MATTAERIARLEQRMDDADRRTRELDANVNGGAGVDWPQSVRGKLHAMQSALAAADNLRKAATEISAAQASAERTVKAAHGRRWSRLTQAALVACAIVTAVAPYVLHFTG